MFFNFVIDCFEPTMLGCGIYAPCPYRGKAQAIANSVRCPPGPSRAGIGRHGGLRPGGGGARFAEFCRLQGRRRG